MKFQSQWFVWWQCSVWCWLNSPVCFQTPETPTKVFIVYLIYKHVNACVMRWTNCIVNSDSFWCVSEMAGNDVLSLWHKIFTALAGRVWEVAPCCHVWCCNEHCLTVYAHAQTQTTGHGWTSHQLVLGFRLVWRVVGIIGWFVIELQRYKWQIGSASDCFKV